MRPAVQEPAQPPCTRVLAEARREAARLARRLPALRPGVDYVLRVDPGPVLGPGPAPTTLAPVTAR